MTRASPIAALYERAAGEQWLPEEPFDWSKPVTIDPGLRDAWARAIDVVYALEYVGLDVVARMTAPVTRRLDDPWVRLYMGVQVADEARHVSVLERYLTLHLGARSRMRQLARFYGYFANPTIYRSDTWFFTTLFSENTASQFMKMVCESDTIDDLGRDIFRRLHKDEGRHLRFLHLATPAVAQTMSVGAKAFVRASQRVLLGFGIAGIKGVSYLCRDLGMNGDELIERVIHALRSQYRQMDIDRYIGLSELLPGRRELAATAAV